MHILAEYRSQILNLRLSKINVFEHKHKSIIDLENYSNFLYIKLYTISVMFF